MTIQNWKKAFLVFGLGITAATSLLPVSANSAPAPKQASKVESFRVVGTEPFWGIDISQKGIVYTSLGENINKQGFRYVAPTPAQGRPLDVVRVYRFGTKPNHILILNKVDGYCSDSMSDTKYPYTATLISGNTVKTGCAQKK
jgi:uncharacterized membrane protein